MNIRNLRKKVYEVLGIDNCQKSYQRMKKLRKIHPWTKDLNLRFKKHVQVLAAAVGVIPANQVDAQTMAFFKVSYKKDD